MFLLLNHRYPITPKFKDGGEVTEDEYVEYLNELGNVYDMESEEWIMGGAHRYASSNGNYGEAMKEHDPVAFRVGYNDWAREQDAFAGGGDISVGEKLSEHEFVSGTKYWRIPFAIKDGEKFKIGDTVYWMDNDDDVPMKGKIDWMMIDENGSVQASMVDEKADVDGNWEDSGWGREDVKNLSKSEVY